MGPALSDAPLSDAMYPRDEGVAFDRESFSGPSYVELADDN